METYQCATEHDGVPLSTTAVFPALLQIQSSYVSTAQIQLPVSSAFDVQLDIDYHTEQEQNLDLQNDSPSMEDVLSLGNAVDEDSRIPHQHMITIAKRKKSLVISRIATQLLPHLTPYQLSFWTDASIRGSEAKGRKRTCGFCVVYRRFEKYNPNDPHYTNTWWSDCWVAHHVKDPWHGEILAVVEALKIAVAQCERISGIVVTRKSRRHDIEQIKEHATTITWPVPKSVNVFTDSQDVLRFISRYLYEGIKPAPYMYPDVTLARRSPVTQINNLISALSVLHVKVRFFWVPGHSGDFCNTLADKGAKSAARPHLCASQKNLRKPYLVKSGRAEMKVENFMLECHLAKSLGEHTVQK